MDILIHDPHNSNYTTDIRFRKQKIFFHTFRCRSYNPRWLLFIFLDWKYWVKTWDYQSAYASFTLCSWLIKYSFIVYVRVHTIGLIFLTELALVQLKRTDPMSRLFVSSVVSLYSHVCISFCQLFSINATAKETSN